MSEGQEAAELEPTRARERSGAKTPAATARRRLALPAALSRDLLIGIVAGALVGFVSTVVTETREDDRSQRAERLENLRFMRTASDPDRAAQRIFAGLDLAGLPMSGLDLSAADLRGAVLVESVVDGADLTGADLSGVEAREARFVGADMSDITAGCLDFDDDAGRECSDFTESLLTGADLTGADLRHASLTEADLRDAVLDGANLSGADLTDALLPELPLGAAAVIHGCGDAETVWPSGVTVPPSAPCPA